MVVIITNEKTILSLDPGTVETGYVLITENFKVLERGKIPNDKMIKIVEEGNYDEFAIEIISNVGGIVGATTFDTAELVGKLCYIAEQHGVPIHRVKRSDIRRHFKLKRKNAKKGIPGADAQLSRKLSLMFANDPHRGNGLGKGTKANPDFFYGFVGDTYSAFAIALYSQGFDGEREGKENEF